ncbi:uncharacterized protein LOC111412664 [Olea europaea var. sylvestris]|uniref:uncharacterized protein LOC111412664 n=1 Tax=Olea europaea var. sylvestris TaxID=158386 RepID=UPI000C1D14C9|nr:uncharacterized protein LOC111412664 [Olea europaea var. sylvestris]
MDKTPAVARNLIANVAANSQQFGSREVTPVKQARHPTYACPTLQERASEQANAVGGFSMQQGHRYDPYANIFNLRLRDHPNLSYGGNHFIAPQSQFNHSWGSINKGNHNTFNLVNKLHLKVQRYLLKIWLKDQEKLRSQAINSTENANAVTLRSGKILEEAPRKVKDQVEESTQEKNLACEKDEAKTPTSGSKVDSKSPIPIYVLSPPFPGRLKGNEVVSVEENVSEVLQKKLPPKCKDPGTFTIPYIIGNTRFEKAMLDLRAFINVMPYSIYASLNLGSLKEIGVIIQFVDRSNAFSKGVLEDVLVKVNQVIFPTDFYVFDMQDESTSLMPPFLLGRPFMRTARTKIDVHDSTLTMEFDGEIIHFNIFETMRYPSDVYACFSIDIMDSFVQKKFNLSNEDALDTTLIKRIDVDNLIGLRKNLQPCKDIVKTVASLESLSSIPPRYNLSYITLPISKEKLLPSVMQAPTLELKHFPQHLKYVWERGKQYR